MRALDYGRAFTLWRAACPDAWAAYTDDVFVKGLSDGTLPRSAFLNYLRQDYLFLIRFARAWSLAVVKAASLAEMRVANATVHALLSHELGLHVQICAAEGISQHELDMTKEAPETIAYTRFVLETGFSGDFLDLLAALAPCVLGYGEIGFRLLAEEKDTPYRQWIETYGGPDYQELCRETGALIDGAIARRLGHSPETLPRWQELTQRFTVSTALEGSFWNLSRP